MIRSQPLVIHVRITKACNADCSYCSSYQENPDNRMRPNQFKAALPWLIEEYEKIGVSPTHVTIEYVGGEILTVPPRELSEIVFFTRQFFSSKNIKCHDGVQTNLLGSKKRLEALYSLFDGRIGTSIDRRTESRKLSGSASKYRMFFAASEAGLQSLSNGNKTPAILTLTKENLKFVLREVQESNIEGRNLTIRPVFHGGKDVELLSNEEIKAVFVRVFERWFMKSNILIEPFFSLLKKLLKNSKNTHVHENLDLCPFQSNCHERSISIEPNGDVYICQDLADAGKLKIGNALSKELYHDVIQKVSERSMVIADICRSCDFKNVCHGGCMLHSVEKGFNLTAKTPYCDVWFDLLTKMSEMVDKEELGSITRWMNGLENK